MCSLFRQPTLKKGTEEGDDGTMNSTPVITMGVTRSLGGSFGPKSSSSSSSSSLGGVEPLSLKDSSGLAEGVGSPEC